MAKVTAKDVIRKYALQPHPEGGYYKEVYRSEIVIGKDALPERFNGDRSIATSIYFLLEENDFSAFHKIKSDETWHFYAGDKLEVYIILPEGELEIIQLGSNIAKDETFQFTVPADCWFASKPAVASKFCFVGCTVYPGFDFADFKMAERNALLQNYPQHAPVIQMLT